MKKCVQTEQLNKTKLKREVLRELKELGFGLKQNSIKLVAPQEREFYKKVQLKAKREKLKKRKDFLKSKFKLIAEYLRDGESINPEKIEITLVPISADTKEEALFRWWNLVWWSIPYERSYGRQMRFLLWDVFHNAPFGLICLQSPTLKMGARDKKLGINKRDIDVWVNMSLSAQRLGALPPYNELLGSKMIALALASNEIRTSYKEKYENCKTLIRNRTLPADLLFITTTAAFGKSSIYNRLKYDGEIIAEFIGYTKGSGTFHISETLYRKILHFLEAQGINVAGGYGHGSSRKRRLLSIAFRLLGLPSFQYHGFKRGIYLIPHAANVVDIIHHHEKPDWYDRPLDKLFVFWKERWCIPRSKRVIRWRNFKKDEFIEDTQKFLGEL